MTRAFPFAEAPWPISGRYSSLWCACVQSYRAAPIWLAASRFTRPLVCV